MAAHIGEDFWSVELRIPVTGTDTTEDPLHGVVGIRPSENYPWYFNVYRQRPRTHWKESSGFSPTGGHFGLRNRFAKLYTR